jgi:hypothetical protein
MIGPQTLWVIKFKSGNFFSARTVFLSEHFGGLGQNGLFFGVFVFFLDDHEHSQNRDNVTENHFEEVLANANYVEELQLFHELLRKYNG